MRCKGGFLDCLNWWPNRTEFNGSGERAPNTLSIMQSIRSHSEERLSDIKYYYVESGGDLCCNHFLLLSICDYMSICRFPFIYHRFFYRYDFRCDDGGLLILVIIWQGIIQTIILPTSPRRLIIDLLNKVQARRQRSWSTLLPWAWSDWSVVGCSFYAVRQIDGQLWSCRGSINVNIGSNKWISTQNKTTPCGGMTSTRELFIDPWTGICGKLECGGRDLQSFQEASNMNEYDIMYWT